MILIVKGVVIIIIFRLLSEWLNLYSVGILLEYVFEWGPLALIVLFQPELRSFLESIGRTKLLGRHKVLTVEERERVVYEIMDAVEYLKKNKIGALIVLERDVSLQEYISPATKVYADLTSPLLGTIFFPNSPLHDGGVIIQGNKITCAGAVFKTSMDPNLNKKLGTRHRAALGIAEESDAIALIVSEETGRLSMAIGGELFYNLTLEEIRLKLLEELRPKKLSATNIEKLIKKDFAYLSNGDVYFRAKRFSQYGKLSHQPLEDLEAGARISVGEIKEDPMDFCLWKSAKPDEPFWESPWGKGRPGWHIECSAMSTRYLGETIDIHCGGLDLIFPHHENEIAQSECANGCEFSHYWMHNGFINVDNRKMSKSLGNFFTVRDVAEKYGYEPIRYLMISSHYRSPINYSLDIITQAQNALSRLYTCRERLDFAISHAESGGNAPDVLKTRRLKFTEALEDDLNTADALAEIFN